MVNLSIGAMTAAGGASRAEARTEATARVNAGPSEARGTR